MKAKSTRKNFKKKYVFIDDEDKEVNVDFKWFALSTEQGQRFQNSKNGERLDVVMDIMKDNLRGDEPYKTALLEYLYSDGNMFEEFSELQESLGKQNKAG